MASSERCRMCGNIIFETMLLPWSCDVVLRLHHFTASLSFKEQLEGLFESENCPLGDGLRHLIFKTVAMSLIRKARTRFTYKLFCFCLFGSNTRWIFFGRVGLAPPSSFLIPSVRVSIPKILRYCADNNPSKSQHT